MNERYHNTKKFVAVVGSPTVINEIKPSLILVEKFLQCHTGHFESHPDVTAEGTARWWSSVSVKISEDVNELLVLYDSIRTVSTSDPIEKLKTKNSLAERAGEFLLDF
jgi:hypothetical protein